MKKRYLLMIIVLILIVGSLYFMIPHYITRDGLCVLGYHGVVSDEDKQYKYKDDRYALSVSQFERQMQYLYKNKYTTYSMDDVYAYYNGNLEANNHAVVLTFDDGYKNFNEIVKPILEKYQFYGTCFVIGKHLDDDKDKFLKYDDLEKSQYVSYYSHSYNLHRKAEGFNKKIIEEISMDEIDQDFKANPLDSTYFAFPYGRSVEGIENVLMENDVKLAFSYNQFRHMTRDDNQYFLPRYMIVDWTFDSYFQWIVE